MSEHLTSIIEVRGQQVWLDNLSRSLIDSGQLKHYIDRGVTGVTSNPAIFFQAISKDAVYQEKLSTIRQLVQDPETRYELMVIKDIQDACDLLLATYRDSQGKKGYVSFEVSPRIANDAHLTIAEAKRLWRVIGRDNAMIKIPATKQGLIAIERLISEGINVNVTLIFSHQQIRDVQEAYRRGIEQRVMKALMVDRIAAVASVFISRVDNKVDPLLSDKAPSLQGKIAISAAKLSYQQWQSRFLPTLAHYQIALPLPLLWASTSVKNPSYPELLYVDELVGKDTINTIPESTLETLLESRLSARGVLNDHLEEAEAVFAAFHQLSFDFDKIGETLLEEGLAIFEKAYDQLIALVSDE